MTTLITGTLKQANRTSTQELLDLRADLRAYTSFATSLCEQLQSQGATESLSRSRFELAYAAATLEEVQVELAVRKLEDVEAALTLAQYRLDRIKQSEQLAARYLAVESNNVSRFEIELERAHLALFAHLQTYALYAAYQTASRS